MMNQTLVEIARKNWVSASKEFEFIIVTPYYINADEIKKSVFAYLPEFGSPNGIVIEVIKSPEFKVDKQLVNWAEKRGIYYSFINIESCLQYRKNFFTDCLKDWGRYN
jgi:hypothetical protein